MPKLLTISQVAKRLGVASHRVDYLVSSRAIKEAGRVGNYRVYGEQEVELIKAALADSDSRLTPLRAVATMDITS